MMYEKINETDTEQPRPNLEGMKIEALMKLDGNNITVNFDALQISENFAEIEKELIIHLANLTAKEILNAQ